MKRNTLRKYAAFLLALVMCLSALPMGAAQAKAEEELYMEPVVLLMENLHQMVNEIPIGKLFATSMDIGAPETFESLALVNKKTGDAVLLYENGTVLLGGRFYSDEEGPYFMVDFRSSDIPAGDYYFRVVNGGATYTDPTVFTFFLDPNYVSPPVITDYDPVDGFLNQKYSYTFKATAMAGGALTWSIENGSLPKGLTLNAKTGVISGTPAEDGFFSFTIVVKEAGGKEASSFAAVYIAAPKRYNVRFNLRGGTGASGADYSTRYLMTGTELTMPAAPKKSGYRFIGWEGPDGVVLPGARITVEKELNFYAEWKALQPVSVRLPDSLKTAVGYLWLTGTCEYGDRILWRGRADGETLPVIEIDPWLLPGYTYSAISLYGYVNGEAAVLAGSSDAVDESTDSVALSLTDVKWDLIRGVTVAGEKANDYYVDTVAFTSGGKTGELGYFPCMARAGSTYTVTLRRQQSYRIAWLPPAVRDVYQSVKLADGYLTVTPVSSDPDALVKGVVSIDGEPSGSCSLFVSQTLGDYTMTRQVEVDKNGAFSIRLYKGVPAEFTPNSDWYGGSLYTESGAVLQSPSDGATHNISARNVKLNTTLTLQSASEQSDALRYLAGLRYGYSLRTSYFSQSKNDQVLRIDLSKFKSSLTVRAADILYLAKTEEKGELDVSSDSNGRVVEPVKAPVTITKGVGEVSVKTTLNAGVVVPLSAETTGSYFLCWFDTKGNFAGAAPSVTLWNEVTDYSAVCPDPAGGSYTLVLIPGVYRNAVTLSDLKLSALNTDQSVNRWTVSLKKSEQKVLTAFRSDTVASENALYVTKPHSTLDCAVSSFSGVDQLVAVRGTVGLDAGLPNGKLDGLYLKSAVNSKGTLVPVSLTINGKSCPINVSLGNITADLQSLSAEELSLPCSFTLYAKPYDNGVDMVLSAVADVSYNKENANNQPVGSVTVKRPGASIWSPSEYVCSDTVRLSGTAKPGETVRVYDGGVLIGTAKADNNGRWQGRFAPAFTDEKYTTSHSFRAESASGVKTAEVPIFHKKNGPELRDILLTFDNRGPISMGGSYPVSSSGMRNVHFEALFEHPEALETMPDWDCKVALRLYLGDGEVRILKTRAGKNGSFTLDIAHLPSYVAGVEALYQAKPDDVQMTADKTGVLTASNGGGASERFSQLSAALRAEMKVSGGKTVFMGKTAKDSLSVSFSSGKASFTGNVQSAAGEGTEKDLKKSFEEAAAEFDKAGAGLRAFDIRYRDSENLLTWLNTIGDEKAAQNKAQGDKATLSYYTRTSMLGDKASFANAKAAVEKYAVNPAYSEGASAANHRKLTLGKNQTFDQYVLTDFEWDEDGALTGGNYYVLAGFFSDTSASPAVYLSQTVAILGEKFEGYGGVKEAKTAAARTASILAPFVLRADAWEQFIYNRYDGHYTEDAATSYHAKVEDYTAKAATLTGAPSSVIGVMDDVPVKVSRAGKALGVLSLGAAIWNFKAILDAGADRIGERGSMKRDLENLINSPCFKRLNEAEKDMCMTAYNRFMEAFEHYDDVDTGITTVGVGLGGGGIAATAIGFHKVYGKPASWAGMALTDIGGSISDGNAQIMKNAKADTVREYENAYKVISHIIIAHSMRANTDDCKRKKDHKGVERFFYNVYEVTYDPAGIVYEGVIENPVENAAVTLWYGVDGSGNIVKEANAKNVKKVVRATDVTSKTPVETTQFTGADGVYQWFVPEGLWFVTAEYGGMKGSSAKDLAATAAITQTTVNGEKVSKLLPVLPIQLDVNIPLVDASAPAVQNVRFTTEGVYVTFTKYMVDTAKGADSVLNPANYTLTAASGKVPVAAVTPVEQGHTPSNIDGKNTKTYTRTVLLTPKTALQSGETAVLQVKKGVKSYAGAAMGADFADNGTVTANTALAAPVINGGAKQTLAFGSRVTIALPDGAPANAKIMYTTDGTDPTENSKVYTAPVAVSNTMTLKAVVVCPGYPDSKVVSAAVTVGDAAAFQVTGDVTANNGDVTEGLTVTISGGSYKKTAKVQSDGTYSFEAVPVGTYTLSFAGSDKFAAASAKVTVSTFDPWVNLKLTAKGGRYTPGDVNNDGSIGADDARLALRRSVDLEDYPEGSMQFLACDVNADKAVGADDARLILRASVDLEDAFKWQVQG